MIKKPFFSCGKPKLKYPVIQHYEKDAIEEVPLPAKVTLFLDGPYFGIDDKILKKGDEVKTGQKITITEEGDKYFIATATGAIDDISEYIGYLGRSYFSISVKTGNEEQRDNEFKKISNTASPENVKQFLDCLPGEPDFTSIIRPEASFNTIVIYGIDRDLLVTTNQLIVKTESENLKKGITYLREITNTNQIILIVPPWLLSDAGKIGAEIKVVNPAYPDTLPEIIIKNVFNKIVPAGKSYKEMGICFINAEAVAALGEAFSRGEIPVNKILTVINKDGTSFNMKARIGTPVKDILASLNLETNHGDRLVLGGPMTGNSIYSEDIPVLSDTDAIMIQDKSQIVSNPDIPCINCGECVRVCPSNVPVNMLVRLLENGLYEEAVEEYDLLSCIECGLCAYVCVAQIPVFHYIILGKYEYEKMKSMEESHA
ncbi:4Fe-4S dicluster domain-containing protein [Thermodesulfobacteriota bacterium]